MPLKFWRIQYIEFADKVNKQIQNQKLLIVPYYDGPTQRKPTLNLAKKILNWEPKIMLAEGYPNY